MTKSLMAKIKNSRFPLIVEKDEDGFYVVECPIFRGCYTQSRSIDKALKNIREVIMLCLEEKTSQVIAENYKPRELSLHTINL